MKPTLDTERLKHKREEKGWSKNQAAQEIGILQSSYLRYESGENNPSVSALKNIAWTLGTSVEYLTGKSNDDRPMEYLVDCSDSRLADIISTYKSSSEDQKDRIYAYIKRLKKK
jgi:transcriptional regulator with XRE-family HTH domain